jgi:peptidoglycan/LPS O-acetylase OafA/YrhL
MRHSANLDILRTFAVSSVLVQHLVLTLTAHAGFQNVAIIEFTSQIGRAGVISFFVHTSLVLMYSLERLCQSADRVSLRFYLRRFFRIYPLAIFCITLALILHIPSTTWEAPNAITPRVIVANLCLVQNLITKISIIGPLWSLPYEIQMYVALPALYYIAIRKHAVGYICGLIALFCCLGFLVAEKSGGHLNMAAYIPCFLCGVLCYSLRNRICAFLPSALWPIFILLLISGYCLTNMNGRPSFWKGWIFCLLLGLAINAFHNSSNRPINIAAERIALYSYGIYLLHVPALYLVFMVLGIRNLLFGPLLSVALTLFASFITYHVIESPFINIGRKLSSRRRRTLACLSPQEKYEGS